MQRNHLQKNGYKQFLINNKTGAIRENFNFDLFSNFSNFHVFLVNALKIISADEYRNMHIFHKKIFQS